MTNHKIYTKNICSKVRGQTFHVRGSDISCARFRHFHENTIQNSELITIDRPSTQTNNARIEGHLTCIHLTCIADTLTYDGQERHVSRHYFTNARNMLRSCVG